MDSLLQATQKVNVTVGDDEALGQVAAQLEVNVHSAFEHVVDPFFCDDVGQLQLEELEFVSCDSVEDRAFVDGVEGAVGPHCGCFLQEASLSHAFGQLVVVMRFGEVVPSCEEGDA